MRCDVGFLGVPASPPSHLPKFENRGEAKRLASGIVFRGVRKTSKRSATEVFATKNAPPNCGGASRTSKSKSVLLGRAGGAGRAHRRRAGRAGRRRGGRAGRRRSRRRRHGRA